MREIKFRAKRKLNGDWVYGSLVRSDEEDWDCIITEYSGDLIDCDNIRVITNTIGQFTGLKDKNGKEIYEGDILNWDYCGTTEWKEWMKEPCYRVEYMDGYFVCGKGLDQDLFLHAYRFKYTEVVGNIYENPELLKTL